MILTRRSLSDNLIVILQSAPQRGNDGGIRHLRAFLLEVLAERSDCDLGSERPSGSDLPPSEIARGTVLIDQDNAIDEAHFQRNREPIPASKPSAPSTDFALEATVHVSDESNSESHDVTSDPAHRSAQRPQSAVRDFGFSIGTDFIASPLHCFVRHGFLPERPLMLPSESSSDEIRAAEKRLAHRC